MTPARTYRRFIIFRTRGMTFRFCRTNGMHVPLVLELGLTHGRSFNLA